MNTPLSYSSLLTQADENWNRYKAEADARDAAFYGPGKLQRTVMRPIEQRLPPQWDAFMQALQNSGGGRIPNMRSFPTTQSIGKTNQLGVSSTPASMAPLNDSWAGLGTEARVNMDGKRVNMDKRKL